MISNKTFVVIIIAIFWAACQTKVNVNEADKILHAGPANDGFGVKFFELYKHNMYRFCDGDFMDNGCYVGIYRMYGDTIIMQDLKKHEGIPSNRFLLRRYVDMDSSYWKWKYPNNREQWKFMQHRDSVKGSTGDIYPLTENGRIVMKGNNFFLIRLDKIKNNQ